MNNGSFKLSNEILSNIISSLYEAAIDDRLWNTALKKIGEPILCHCTDMISIGEHDFQNQLYIADLSNSDLVNFNAILREEIESGFNIKVNFTKSAEGTGYWSDRNYIKEREMPKHSYYQEGSALINDTYHGGGFILENDSNHLTAIGSFRSKKLGGFQEKEISYYNLLAPHILRAIEIGRIQRYHNLSLNHISLNEDSRLNENQPGLVLLNQAGKIVEMNRKAANIFGMNDGITDSNTMIAIANRTAHQNLVKDIKALITKPHSDTYSQPRYINIPSTSGKRRYKLFVAPITHHMDRFFGYYGAVYVFEYIEVDSGSIEALADHFQLTPAESKLALDLLKGYSLKSYAKKHSISIETPRYHLKNIFLKTDTNRQADLIIKLQKFMR